MEIIIPEIDVANCRRHAEQRRNYYRPAPGVNPPAADIRHHVNFPTALGEHIAVFSFTVGTVKGVETVYRHLTVLAKDFPRPPPIACFKIAKAMGFTGWPVPAFGELAVPGDWEFGFAGRTAIIIQKVD